jgi:ATP-dependent exoDNAse (exonuclease V) beta subunit
MKTKPLSFSQIDIFRACRYWYWLKYIQNTPDIETAPLRKGKAIHKAIELYGKYLSEHNLMSSLSAEQEIMSMLTRELAKSRLDSISCDMNEEELADVREMFNRYINNHIYAPTMKDIISEFKLSFNAGWERCGWDDSNAYFRAIIDQVHKEGDLIVVTDFKSNMHVPAASIVDDNLQLEIYAFLMSLIYTDYDRFFIRLDFIRWNRQIERTIRKDEIEKVPDRIAEYRKQIDEFDRWGTDETAMLGSHCDTKCPYIARCPNFQAALMCSGDVIIKDDKQAFEAADKYISMKLALKKYETRLKAYIKRTEKNIPLGLKTSLGFHGTTMNTVAQIKPIIDELVQKGVPKEAIYDKLTLSYTGLGKLIEDNDRRLFKRYDEWREKKWIIQTNSSTFKLGKE